MPWSDWMDTAPLAFPVNRLRLQWGYSSHNSGDVSWDSYEAQNVAGEASTEVAIDFFADIFTPDTDYHQLWTAWQYEAPSVYPTWLDYNVPLQGLTFGVDYGLRPDRDGSEKDRYVEFEDSGPNTIATWGLGITRPPVFQARGDGTTFVPCTWTIGIRTGTTYAAGPMLNPVFPGVGSVVASAHITEEGVQDIPVAFPDPVASASITIASDLQLDTLDHRFNVADLSGVVPTVGLKITQPRHRYWIPRALPLRQRQRDDGLGLSTNRWRRGRSVQASNRWRSYR